MKKIQHTNPDGGVVTIHIGNDTIIGTGASIGDYASIGNGAIIGNDARIGNYARIGTGASIGNDASIGNGAIIGDYASIEHSSDALNGYGLYLWTATKDVLTYGCESHPITTWTEEFQANKCHEHNPEASRHLAQVVRTVRAYFDVKD